MEFIYPTIFVFICVFKSVGNTGTSVDTKYTVQRCFSDLCLYTMLVIRFLLHCRCVMKDECLSAINRYMEFHVAVQCTVCMVCVDASRHFVLFSKIETWKNLYSLVFNQTTDNFYRSDSIADPDSFRFRLSTIADCWDIQKLDEY